MSSTGMLGSFEELVLLAVLRTDDDAYAVSVRREIADRSGSDVAMGSVYATLDRLEEKGLIVWELEEPGGERVGRPRRYYAIRAAGLAALAETRGIRRAMWRGVKLAGQDGRS